MVRPLCCALFLVFLCSRLRSGGVIIEGLGTEEQERADRIAEMEEAG